GLRSHEIAAVLGYADSEYVALRENVSLVKGSGSGGKEQEREAEAEVVREKDKEKGVQKEAERGKGASRALGNLGSFG
ncbi:MAG: hypothetical protein LQ340_008107, partial [Diploschistes diacapsis]